MNLQQLNEIETLLKENLIKNKKVLDQKVTRLTAPGDNYCSLMLALQIMIRDEHAQKVDVLHAVAKLIPPNEFLQKRFNTQCSFKFEMDFYTTVIPTLQNFRIQRGAKEMDIFPECFGARINLNGGDVVDENAVILLENLKVSGYTLLDRLIGFNLQTTKFIIKEMARFHATSLALKLTEPQVFDALLKSHIRRNTLFQSTVMQLWEEVLNENEETVPLIPTVMEVLKEFCKEVREPLATIIHNDLWLNNVMIKFDDIKPIGIKVVDYQECEYRSPMADLLFFLFSSVQTTILEEHLDSFIIFYHENLSKMLIELDCETTQFPLELILKEVQIEAKKSVLFQLGFMVFSIFCDRDSVKDITELTEDNLRVTGQRLQKEKMWFYVKEFAKRNWL